MLTLIIEIIVIIVTVFLVDTLTYIWIRKLDKKERDKLAKKESEYLKKMIQEMNGEQNSVV